MNVSAICLVCFSQGTSVLGVCFDQIGSAPSDSKFCYNTCMSRRLLIRFRSLFFFGTFLCAFCYLFAYLIIATQATTDTARASDIIMILGEESYWGEAYNPCLVARVNHGVSLYKKGYASKILFSGGFDENNPLHNEAETMKEIALARAVPTEDILLEKNSTSTYENIVFSKPLFEQNNVSSVLIVTAPFHSPRALWTAQKQLDISVSVSPSTNNPCWEQNPYLSRFMLREPIALIYYALLGRL